MYNFLSVYVKGYFTLKICHSPYLNILDQWNTHQMCVEVDNKAVRMLVLFMNDLQQKHSVAVTKREDKQLL